LGNNISKKGGTEGKGGKKIWKRRGRKCRFDSPSFISLLEEKERPAEAREGKKKEALHFLSLRRKEGKGRGKRGKE